MGVQLLLKRVTLTQVKFNRIQGKLFHDESSQKPVLHELGLINMFDVIYVVLFCFVFDWCLFCVLFLLYYFKLNLSVISFVESRDKTLNQHAFK